MVAASLGSLKGPRHGGANIKVVKMFDDMKANIKSRSDGDVKDYLCKLLDKEAFDKSGLIYGMGHAVYSLSDPRAKMCIRDSLKALAIWFYVIMEGRAFIKMIAPLLTKIGFQNGKLLCHI